MSYKRANKSKHNIEVNILFYFLFSFAIFYFHQHPNLVALNMHSKLKNDFFFFSHASMPSVGVWSLMKAADENTETLKSTDMQAILILSY